MSRVWFRIFSWCSAIACSSLSHSVEICYLKQQSCVRCALGTEGGAEFTQTYWEQGTEEEVASRRNSAWEVTESPRSLLHSSQETWETGEACWSPHVYMKGSSIHFSKLKEWSQNPSEFGNPICINTPKNSEGKWAMKKWTAVIKCSPAPVSTIRKSSIFLVVHGRSRAGFRELAL